MSLRFGLSVVILSTVFVSRMILPTEAHSGAARHAHHITFDCDPEQLRWRGQARLPGEEIRRGSPSL